MKYLVKFFVVTFFLLVCTYASAETEQKIVYLDMKFILNNSQAGKGAQDFLKKTFNENQNKFIDKEKELKREENDLLAKKSILTKEEYRKNADELRKKVIDYKSERRLSLEKITTNRLEARQKLLEKINPILDTYIKENNISVVIDKKSVLGGQSDHDITNIIVEKLNKELPSLNLK